MNKGKRDLELLFEMGALRFIDRTWKQFENLDYENLVEHHFRVAWIALILARREGVTNTEKIIKMAMSHDIAESRTGDANYLSRQYVTRDEKTGIKDILKGTSIEDEFLTLWEEYEKRESIEAKIVKDADNLDVDLELREQEAKGYPRSDKWKKMRQRVISKNLFTKSAKDLWDEIQKANPNDWHEKGRNRFTSGDWSEK